MSSLSLFTPLNWLEISILISKLKPQIEGLFVDRIIIPERILFPEGYLKGEWGIRLIGKRTEAFLLLSIRPRHPYILFTPSKGPKASLHGTQSPFFLAANKLLKGKKIIQVEILPKERTVIFWLKDTDPYQKLGLVINLIPASPDACLITQDQENELPMLLTTSKDNKDSVQEQRIYRAPDGKKAPENPPISHKNVEAPEKFYHEVQLQLETEAFEIRKKTVLKTLQDQLKQISEKIHQNQTILTESNKEQNWKLYGDLLKSVLFNPPPLLGKYRELKDFESEQIMKIPCDPKLSPQEQVEKFYQLARKRKRREEECQDRLNQFLPQKEKLLSLLGNPPLGHLKPLDWKTLEKLEDTLNIRYEPVSNTGKTPSPKNKTTWFGKTFKSTDGLPIWVGKSKEENLELTFKHAKGNDIWMHLRGKPGAHVVIPLPSGKSAPLETLLDAAHLTIFYSGGQNWGKTEVDYTFKKYVKRIKNSTEASYTHNKTLIINFDSIRIKKLLDKAL